MTDNAFSRLGDTVVAMQKEMGRRLVPVFGVVLDRWTRLMIEARYVAANKRGLVLALFITGVAIICH